MNRSNYLCIVNVLIRHIEYLILRHDCVTVPGWGAFIANYQPARVDSEFGCIFPPCRTIGFNASLTHSDGLTSSIARGNGITYDNASTLIADEVNAMRHALESGGSITFGRLGSFSRNDEGSIVFEPATATNIAPDYTGLIAVKAVDLAETLKKRNESASVYYVPVSRNILKIVASIALLIGLGFMLSTPIIQDEANYAGIATPMNVTKPAPVYTVPSPDIELSIALPDPTTSRGTFTPAVTTAQQSAVTTAAAKPMRYFLVVASLPTRKAADEYIAHSVDRDSLSVLESGGRYRVYIAVGATYSDAFNKRGANGYGDRYPDAWVCKR